MFFENLVFLEKDICGKKEIFEFLTQKMFEAGKIPDTVSLLRDVNRREDLCTTYIGRSAAVPHGVSQNIDEIVVSFMALKQPADWGDGESVKFVFLIAIPANSKASSYIESIGRLSRMLLDDEVYKLLLCAKSAKEVMQVFSTI